MFYLFKVYSQVLEKKKISRKSYIVMITKG